MKQYLDLCKHVLSTGVLKGDRTGTGTLSVFGYQMRYDLSKGFPLVTTKDMMSKNKLGVNRLDMIIYELMWIIRGETNIRHLAENNVNIWNKDAHKAYQLKGGELDYKAFMVKILEDDDFASEYGDLGNVYGKQWRSWDDGDDVIDQLMLVIKSLKEDPDSRRHLVSAWNAADVHKNRMTLPPCHTMFQFYVANGRLSCQLYQRSGDIFLGVPFNIASYALLTTLIAREVGLEPGEFIHTLGDAHIYTNHIDQMKEQISREPRDLPVLITVNKRDSILDYGVDDFELVGYDPHPELKGKQSS